MNTFINFITTDFHMIRIFCRTGYSLDILWQIDQDRTRLAGFCNMKCHLDRSSKIFAVADRYTIFCNTARHTYDIHFLERIIANEI